MLKSLSKIALMATPAFIACHLIKENKEVARKYCPIIKHKTSNTAMHTSSISKKNEFK
jgi:hypothetical protein